MQAFDPAKSSRFLTFMLLTGLTTAMGTAGCSSEDGDDPDDAGTGGDASGGDTGSGGEEASGGAASGGAASGGDSSTLDYPTDSSEAGIEAFLEAESYKSSPWVGDAAPRPNTQNSPHLDDLRVYFNTAAVEATENATTAAINAMTVKELYDPGGALVGKMARLKTGEGTSTSDWTNYCYVSDGSDRCTGVAGDDNPYYETEGLHSCTFCHANEGFSSPLPE